MAISNVGSLENRPAGRTGESAKAPRLTNETNNCDTDTNSQRIREMILIAVAAIHGTKKRNPEECHVDEMLTDHRVISFGYRHDSRLRISSTDQQL